MPTSTTIVIAILLLLAVWQLPAAAGFDPLPTASLLPQSQPPHDEPSWLEEVLVSAWRSFSTWVDGLVSGPMGKLESLISQFWQNLVAEATETATQKYEDLLRETCGTALLLPLGAFAGVWLLSRRR